MSRPNWPRRWRVKGFGFAVLAADGWLNLLHVRFGCDDPGDHFYSHAFRFEEMFFRLIEPLARDGSSHLTAEYAEETATCYRKHVYEFDDLDVILLEGIFLFKRKHQQRYDFRLWIDCSFKTALEWTQPLSRGTAAGRHNRCRAHLLFG